MTTDLPGFDAVVSNAALHHVEDTRAALERFAGLVSPGGTLAVVTFVKPSLGNVLWHLTSWLTCAVANRVKGKPETLRPLRTHVQTLLPGARIRRLFYGRVVITWCAPASRASSDPHRRGGGLGEEFDGLITG